MNLIKLLLRQQFINEELLDEKIGAGSFIVYHRTKNPNPKTYNAGFKVGDGAMYGGGLYTTYELESQLNDEMSRVYGDTIIQFQIHNNGKFIILDEPQAKIVYGKNYQLHDQLKKVMGGYYNKFIAINKHKGNLDLSNVKYTSDIALQLAQMTGFIQHVDGMIFTGRRDGKVLVLYNTDLANPLQYSTDDGQSWNNMKDVTSHKIGRDSRTANKNINNFSNVDTKNVKKSDLDYSQIENDEVKFYMALKHDGLNVFMNNIDDDKQFDAAKKIMTGINKDLSLGVGYNDVIYLLTKFNANGMLELYNLLPQKRKEDLLLPMVEAVNNNKFRNTNEEMNNIIRKLIESTNLKDYHVRVLLLEAKNKLEMLKMLGPKNLEILDKGSLIQLKDAEKNNPNKFLYNLFDDLLDNMENLSYNKYKARKSLDENLKKLFKKSLQKIINS